ncbi:lipase 1-like [Ochlerotatus camptorhynchus]|uniref:lipase 1-like n=1 Tax=Ochlerotatus camptorhynchus TaxID=644619 RepID=UPI0031DE1696
MIEIHSPECDQLSEMIRLGKCYYCSLRLVLAMLAIIAHEALSFPQFFQVTKAAQYGMQPEKYTALTEDGYQLVMYRMMPKSSSRGLVLLQHGIRQSSADWLKINQNLPKQLLSAGMEVWLGNSRASLESAGHTYLNKDSTEFWDFSFHEIGYYDLAAMIDTALARSKRNKLHLVAYSEGSTAALTLLSERPSYNAKVASLNLIAPATFLGNSHVRGLATLLYRLRLLLPWSLQKLVTGSDEPYENSPKQLEHFQQLLVTGRFHQYDYGFWDNQKRYGGDNPPPYSLWRVTAPVTLHVGGADRVVHPKDVRKLARQLHRSSSVRMIQHERFDHRDFLSLPDAAREVYPRITSAIMQRLR